MIAQLILLFSMLASHAAVQVQAPTGDIEGVVLWSDTGQPIPFTPVIVWGGGGDSDYEFSVVADSGGRFRLTGVPLGTYRVELGGDGAFLPGPGGDNRQAIFARVVSPGQTAPVTLRINPESGITGRILNADGSAGVGLTVQVLRIAYTENGRRQWPQAGSGSVTDSEGEYRVSGLAPGQYYLRVSNPPNLLSVDVPSRSSAEVTAVIYYPGVMRASNAAPVIVRSGYDAVANLSLVAGPTYSIRGTVTSVVPSMEVLPPIRLTLIPEEVSAPIEQNERAYYVLELPGGGNGEFELLGVLPGAYELFASWPLRWNPGALEGERVLSPAREVESGFPSGAITGIARTSFAVQDDLVEGLTLVLRPGVDVTGSLEVTRPSEFELFRPFDGSTTGTLDRGKAYIQIALNSQDNAMIGQNLVPEVDGLTFRFPNISEGLYGISVSFVGGGGTAYIEDIRQAGLSIYDDGLFFVGPREPEPLEIIVREAGAVVPVSIRGMTDLEAFVVLVPQEPNMRSPYHYRYQRVRDSNGRSRVTGVAPGNYSVFAWEILPGSPAPPVLDPAFLARYETRGVRISLEAGLLTGSVEVPLIPIGQ